MSLMDITAESLTRTMSREVPEVYVIVAKHAVLGMDEDTIREVIGCTKEELSEVLNDPLYREIRLIVGATQAESSVDLTTGWDKLEQRSLTSLLKRIDHIRDEDQLLRIAAIANKAQRRHQAGKEQGVLDGVNGRSARINLTTRLVQSFTRASGEAVTQSVEKTLSITDGSAVNPSFDEIDNLLHVSANPVLPRQIEIRTETPDVNLDDLNEEMKRSGF
jgi:hypothetical protein